MAQSSSTMRVRRGPPNTPGPVEWVTIATAYSAEASERVVRVQVEAMDLAGTGLGDVWQQNQILSASCGVWWNPFSDVSGSWIETGSAPWQGGAAMRVRWGSQRGFVREIYADLLPGEYNFGACDIIEVSAARWNYEADDVGSDWNVSAEIAAGFAIESTPLKVRARQRVPTSIDNTACVAPPGAYAFEVGGNAESSSEAGVIAYGGIQPAVRNYTTGRWSPPTTPILLARNMVSVHRVSGTAPVVDDGEGATPWDAEIVFFVR